MGNQCFGSQTVQRYAYPDHPFFIDKTCKSIGDGETLFPLKDITKMGVSGYYFYFKVNDRFRHFDMGTALNASKFFEDAIKVSERSTSTEVLYPRNYDVISFVKKAPEEHKPRRGKKVSFKLVTVL